MCVCVSGSRHSDNSHGAMMRGERLQWHTAGILWHHGTPPGCLSLLFAAPLFLSVTTSSLPFPALQLSLPHCTRRPTLSLPVFLFDISEPSLIPFHCLSFAVSPKFSPHLIQLFFLSLFFPIPLPSPGSQKRFSGSPPPTHPVHPPIPSTPAMSVIPSLFLRGIRALQCTV